MLCDTHTGHISMGCLSTLVIVAKRMRLVTTSWLARAWRLADQRDCIDFFVRDSPHGNLRGIFLLRNIVLLAMLLRLCERPILCHPGLVTGTFRDCIANDRSLSASALVQVRRFLADHFSLGFFDLAVLL